MSVQHDTYTVEHIFTQPPAAVFAAWSSPEAKAKWFTAPHEGVNSGPLELDFRIGGRETLSSVWTQKGFTSHYHAVYQNIVPDERIVTASTMHIDDRLLSVSVGTMEFRAEGTGTRLVVTDSGAYLDVEEPVVSRELGMKLLLDQLEASLASKP
ncbi:polyketide cyclase [Pseudonocardiaceae bacterium YIM PH 21723]|nr:polyketide cyclase [Pseudonocardiaceae bacterium YIM PH 21723]